MHRVCGRKKAIAPELDIGVNKQAFLIIGKQLMRMHFVITVVSRIVEPVVTQGFNMPRTDDSPFQISLVVGETHIFVFRIQIHIQNQTVVPSGNTGVNNLPGRIFPLKLMKLSKLIP